MKSKIKTVVASLALATAFSMPALQSFAAPAKHGTVKVAHAKKVKGKKSKRSKKAHGIRAKRAGKSGKSTSHKGRKGSHAKGKRSGKAKRA